jgi:hypothetical protein
MARANAIEHTATIAAARAAAFIDAIGSTPTLAALLLRRFNALIPRI